MQYLFLANINRRAWQYKDETWCNYIFISLFINFFSELCPIYLIIVQLKYKIIISNLHNFLIFKIVPLMCTLRKGALIVRGGLSQTVLQERQFLRLSRGEWTEHLPWRITFSL